MWLAARNSIPPTDGVAGFVSVAPSNIINLNLALNDPKHHRSMSGRWQVMWRLSRVYLTIRNVSVGLSAPLKKPNKMQ